MGVGVVFNLLKVGGWEGRGGVGFHRGRRRSQRKLLDALGAARLPSRRRGCLGFSAILLGTFWGQILYTPTRLKLQPMMHVGTCVQRGLLNVFAFFQFKAPLQCTSETSTKVLQPFKDACFFWTPSVSEPSSLYRKVTYVQPHTIRTLSRVDLKKISYHIRSITCSLPPQRNLCMTGGHDGSHRRDSHRCRAFISCISLHQRAYANVFDVCPAASPIGNGKISNHTCQIHSDTRPLQKSFLENHVRNFDGGVLHPLNL